MGAEINIDAEKEDFYAIRKDGSYYVDKTELLYELVHDSNNMM